MEKIILHFLITWFIIILESVTEKYLSLQFHQFGNITQVVVNRERGHALIYFDQVFFYMNLILSNFNKLYKLMSI